jgi:hypothetical protein
MKPEEWFHFGNTQQFQGLDVVGTHATDSGKNSADSAYSSCPYYSTVKAQNILYCKQSMTVHQSTITYMAIVWNFEVMSKKFNVHKT